MTVAVGAPDWLAAGSAAVGAGLAADARAEVEAVLTALLADSEGWRPDGAVSTPLTETGAPLEVRLTSAGPDVASYTVTPALDRRWFAARLAAERAALAVVAPRLGAAGAALRAAVDDLVGAAVPDPGAVPPRATQGLYLGATHAADGALSGLRAYCTLRWGPGPSALAALSPGWAALAVAADGLAVEPAMAAVQVDRAGVIVEKLYLRLPPAGAEAVLAEVARRVGVAPAAVRDAVAGLGPDVRLDRGALVTVRAAEGRVRPEVVVHLGRRSLGADRRWPTARVAATHVGSAALLARVVEAEATGRWEVDVVAIGVAPDSVRAAVYVAPTAA